MEQGRCPLLIILIKEPNGNKCIYMVDTALISCYFNSLAYDTMRSFLWTVQLSHFGATLYIRSMIIHLFIIVYGNALFQSEDV
jgi:hypothetical protein